MGKVFIEESSLSNIGNAIRNKLSISTAFKPSQMAGAIDTIPVAGNQLQELIEGTITTATSPVVKIIKANCFQGCSQLSTAIFPQVKSVQAGAFSSCPVLNSVNLPECSIIQNYAFYSCSRLSSINIPKVSSIGSSAFYSCGLSHISLPAVQTIYDNAFYYAKLRGTLELPECTDIRTQAFMSCYTLSEVILPKIGALGASVFMNCTALTSVQLPDNIWENIGRFGNTFTNCGFSQLIDSRIISAGNAFTSCRNLTTVDLPNCKTINLTNNSALTSVSLPNVYSGSFSNCIQLSVLSLPKYYWCSTSDFYNCYQLSYLDIPLFITISAILSFSAPFANAGKSAMNGLIINAPYLTSITHYGFSNTGLREADFPHLLGGPANIFSSTIFANNSRLTVASFMDLSCISGSTFMSCSNLSALYLRNVNPITAGGGSPLQIRHLLIALI